MADLENLLLQAAGRTGSSGRKNQPRSNPRWQQQDSYSDGSDSKDDDSDTPRYSRRKPSGSQVPLKKRHQAEKSKGGWEDDDDDDDYSGGRHSGDDSDSAPSIGSDLYKDEDDKEQLEKMSELDREMILAERSTRIDDYKLKQLARASSSKTEKARKDSPPPPLNRGRSSSRTDRSATRNALDELRAKRMRQQDPEGYRNRLKDLVPRHGSPTKHRVGSPPSDLSNDGETGGRMDIEDGDNGDEEESPSRLDPLNFDDIRSITIRRSKLVKWFMEPFFEEVIAGCFVRLGIGKTRSSGIPQYRLCMVKNVDATEPDRSYKLENYTTYKYLNVVWINEADAARWQMTQVSDSPPLEEEYKEWLQGAEKNGVRTPTRQEVLDKKEAIQKINNFVYSAATVKQMLQEKKSASRRPVNVAAEKDRLRNELEVAQSRRDEREVERIRARLKELEKMSQRKLTNDKAARLEEMNRRNRAENFKNASELKPINTGLKAGEAGYDPFSRRWTRSRNYYSSKPGEDTNASAANGNGESTVAGNGNVKGLVPMGSVGSSEVGAAATAAALEAAAGAGKLVDTNAPVDQGTESNLLHDFEVPISLAILQELGGPKGLYKGFMARKQKIEATMGYKVPDNDGRRHALTLTVSDYKRRRGLL